MSSESVHPLRISKGATGSSPSKMTSPQPRALTELSPTERRRNSPSWNNISPTKKSVASNDSSPFQPSPKEQVTSPRLFWQNRNTENMLYGRNGSPSPTRRSSIERLQKASRVKNSNILALEQKQEYDPTRIPQIERPLSKVQDNVFGFSRSGSIRSSQNERPSHDPFLSDNKSGAFTMTSSVSPLEASGLNTGRPQSKDQSSPTKSSLSPSKFKSSFDHEIGLWSEEYSALSDLPSGRSSHRHVKSVTFDAAPPQINEYEMATPDLSSIGTNSREGSYDSIEDDEEEEDVLYDPGHMDSHLEDSFDASLEDTDKTPVVGPDDWTRESPLIHRGDPKEYESSPMPDSVPSMATMDHSSPSNLRTDSSNSAADHRPLPPLPGAGHTRSQSTGSATASPGLSQTAERMLGAHRSLPAPPPASTTKTDIQSFISGKMSLEERLKLMMLSDDNGGKTAAEQQRERRLRRSSDRNRSIGSRSSLSRENTPSMVDAPETQDAEEHEEQHEEEEDDNVGDISGLGDYQLPQRISRESIMRRVNGNKAVEPESEYIFSSPGASPERDRHLPLDPDVPIPSTEESIVEQGEEDDQGESSVIITRPADYGEDDEDILDMYDSEVPEDYEDDQDDSHFQSDEELDASDSQYADSESHYSESELSQEQLKDVEASDDVMTPRASTPSQMPNIEDTLPRPAEGLESSDSSPALDPTPALAPAPTPAPVIKLDATTKLEAPVAKLEETKTEASAQPVDTRRPSTPEKRRLSKPEYDGTGWGDPEDEYDDDEPGTPESVIHHPVSDDDEGEETETERVSVEVPERLATIKSSGSKLKTRVSNTPTDLAAMREARRQVSSEIPSIPPIPDRHRNRISRDAAELGLQQEDFLERHPSFKNRSLTLDLDMGLSLDKDFERVIEAQKRGYLMRQNTKLVSASDKDADDSWRAARSGPNSPVKTQRPESWTVEPWNGQTRRSIRKASAMSGAVPPLPGQESNAAALNRVTEEEYNVEMSMPETGERGRLFVKVMGVKDLDLPIPKNERSWFSLTLDNGVHCVTTAWLELARNAPIGQEFELVVPNDLEFQLTLNVKLEKPNYTNVQPSSVRMSKPKPSTFSRVFASPKKRKELEQRHRAEEERFAQEQKEALARQRKDAGSAYELLSPLAAEDGSFARSYVCLKEHETRCFGRPYMVDVACFNEWATEEESFASSVKSKRGNSAGVVRRAPYKVGKLELQLLFVPRPKNVPDDDMPKSMNSCIRELKAAEERLARNWEGPLSQQGGDCPYWRRRYFKLVGTKLTAYHEATRQPRATINLSNAKRLIDDRRALTEKETMGRGGKRRRSAFAEEEEGYMFVEEGFRIRFNNGEVIDFYADTAEDKEGWMKALSDIIGRGDQGYEEDSHGPRSRAKWCELVLKREEQLRRRADSSRRESRRVHSRTKSNYT